MDIEDMREHVDREMRDAARQVRDFARSHPDFESVRMLMGMLIAAGKCDNMEDAYEIAKKGATKEAIATYRRKQRRSYTAAERRASFIVIDGGLA